MEELIAEIESAEGFISFDRSFEIARTISLEMDSNGIQCRKVIINVIENWNKLHPSTYEIWTDLIEAVGFYPYLEKNKERLCFKNIIGELRKELHRSDNINNRFFHEEQHYLLQLLKSDKNVIVSAPTSFGKSLLIEEMIASCVYRNIVIIQPTLALLDETRKKLLKYTDKYKLIVRTSQEPALEKGNIFLFTAERVNEYTQFPKIDFLVIDEFYKLSGHRDDERSASLNNAFYYLLNAFSPKFYLLGPNIDGISSGFAEKYNAVFHKSSYTLVDSKAKDIYKEHEGKFGVRGQKKIYKENTLFQLLDSLTTEQTIIYCSSPSRVRYLAKSFVKYLIENGRPKSSMQYPLDKWVTTYISQTWCVLDFLKYDIGIHDGALQKHISTSTIDYFNEGKIKYLFCTSTIIEGVNTSAKNIVYFDETKGGNPVDYFDYSNIKGRAGRMMEHYVGKIFNFNKPPSNEQVLVDIPFFQQNPISDEILIQIKDEEIIDKTTEQFQRINSLNPKEKELIKNNGVQVMGQKSIIDVMRDDIKESYNLVNWEFPKYQQLSYVLGLAWDYLLVPGETTRPMTKTRLIYMTFNYALHQDINFLIRDSYSYMRQQKGNDNLSNEDLQDTAIQDVFQIMKHWFQYKVPKWLSVMNEIQSFICSEYGLRSGNYVHYANLIENDFLRENLSILSEYGIPNSAIRKLERKIPANLNQDLVLDYIRDKRLYRATDLLEYEKQKIRENIL